MSDFDPKGKLHMPSRPSFYGTDRYSCSKEGNAKIENLLWAIEGVRHAEGSV